MKQDKIMRKIYIRIFSALLAIYLVLMIGFSVFLLMQENKVAKMSLSSYSFELNSYIGDLLQNNTDSESQVTDIAKVKKELANHPFLFNYSLTEIALFSGNYDLISDTNGYRYNLMPGADGHWLVSYTEYTEGTKNYLGYGYIKQEEWFSKDEITEIEKYLHTKHKAKKIGELAGYTLRLHGFWVNNDKIIIPEKVIVMPMYAGSFDKNGNVSSYNGTSAHAKIYTIKHQNTEGLQYYKYGAMVAQYPKYMDKKNNEKQIELRKIAQDGDRLRNYVERPILGISTEYLSLFTYRYYMAQPYKNIISIINDDQSQYSDFWLVLTREVNILEVCGGTLAFVWIICFIVFITAAAILSAQTIKTYNKREELERQRTETANALAHDLKTPLSIISGYSQNLMENIHTEKREYYAHNIQANVERMDKIIKEMLDISKLESDTLKLIFEEVSLKSICSEIISRYKDVCTEKGITTGLDGDTFITAERELIERVIDNFFINALDNTAEYGVINIRIFDNSFEIFNSGSYIPEEKLEEIWLPYRKADISRSNTKGTGLGLSIARRILELHSFSYGAKNLDDGVVFWFKINQ